MLWQCHSIFFKFHVGVCVCTLPIPAHSFICICFWCKWNCLMWCKENKIEVFFSFEVKIMTINCALLGDACITIKWLMWSEQNVYTEHMNTRCCCDMNTCTHPHPHTHITCFSKLSKKFSQVLIRSVLLSVGEHVCCHICVALSLPASNIRYIFIIFSAALRFNFVFFLHFHF